MTFKSINPINPVRTFLVIQAAAAAALFVFIASASAQENETPAPQSGMGGMQQEMMHQMMGEMRNCMGMMGSANDAQGQDTQNQGMDMGMGMQGMNRDQMRGMMMQHMQTCMQQMQSAPAADVDDAGVEHHPSVE